MDAINTQINENIDAIDRADAKAEYEASLLEFCDEPHFFGKCKTVVKLDGKCLCVNCARDKLYPYVIEWLTEKSLMKEDIKLKKFCYDIDDDNWPECKRVRISTCFETVTDLGFSIDIWVPVSEFF